jgi:hypothetical protein
MRIVNAKDIKIDFVGVGAAKSGTSWLAACLAEHPELCMAEPKELNYFCEKAIWPKFRINNSLGPEWLAERFARCMPGQRLGEFSPNYLCDARSPRLILLHNPECRLIFCFRRPVDAVVSFYHQVCKEAPVANSLEGFLDKYPEIYQMGLYYGHVGAFLKVFPRQQCLFLLFDDIQRDPDAVLRQCFSFVGVAPDFSPPSLIRRVNEPKMPRSRSLMTAINWLREFVQNHTVGNIPQRWMWKLHLYRLHRWIVQRNLKPFSPPPISGKIRKRLLDLYRDDTQELATFLGRDLSHWQD